MPPSESEESKTRPVKKSGAMEQRRTIDYGTKLITDLEWLWSSKVVKSQNKYKPSLKHKARSATSKTHPQGAEQGVVDSTRDNGPQDRRTFLSRNKLGESERKPRAQHDTRTDKKTTYHHFFIMNWFNIVSVTFVLSAGQHQPAKLQRTSRPSHTKSVISSKASPSGHRTRKQARPLNRD